MTVTAVDAGPNQVSRSVQLGAPAPELFAMVAEPRRHHEIDGSGTVRENIRCPSEIAEGAKFSMKMRMWGLPYWVVSTVTVVKPYEQVEWRHPLGHRWRWEFEALSPTLTRVTETFDYRNTGRVKDALRYYERFGFVKGNTKGIEATLTKLAAKYPV
ncbi:MAG: hypothetical protein NVS4B6_16990 [Mycobacterium sp.]